MYQGSGEIPTTWIGFAGFDWRGNAASSGRWKVSQSRLCCADSRGCVGFDAWPTVPAEIDDEY